MRRIVLTCAALFFAGCKCGGPGGQLGAVLGSYCKFIDRCPDQVEFPIAYRNQGECVDILNFATTCRFNVTEGANGEPVTSLEQLNPMLDPMLAAECQRYLDQATCDTKLTGCDSDTDAGCNPCSRLFAGSSIGGGGGTGGGDPGKGLDQPCDDTSDCASGFYCLNAKTIPDAGDTCRVCKPLRGLAGDCMNPPRVPCGPGLYCDSTSGTCIGLSPPGAACMSSGTCLSEFCNPRTMTCDVGGKPGDACTTLMDCRQGFCDAATSRCADRRPNSASCTAGPECQTGVCDPGTARCGKPDGAMCNFSSECQGVCDTAADVCRPGTPTGNSCSSSDQCVSKLCHNAKRVCVVPCSAGCAATEYCDTYGGCATPLADGSQCNDDDECTSGFCNDNERCATKPGIGGGCASSSDCFPKGYCSGGMCTAYAKPDEACEGYESCAAPFFCQMGKCTLLDLTCKPAPAGKPCAFLSVCDETSFCDVLDNFTCKPKKASGESCLRSVDCGAGLFCNRTMRTCTPVVQAGGSCDREEVCAPVLFCDESVDPNVCSLPKPVGAMCQEDSNCQSGSCDYTSGTGQVCQAACIPVPPGDQPACHPRKCTEFGFNCGSIDGGCGEEVYCGRCNLQYETCGGSGQAQVCGCTPTAACLPGQCNMTVADGCGRQLQCNTACDGGATCGGGAPKVCGCPSDRTAGPSRASVGASVMIPAMGAGFLPWDNLDKLASQDDAGAHVHIDATGNTSKSSLYLVASGFGFNLPPTASVNGISARIRRRADGDVTDANIGVFAGGVLRGRTSGQPWDVDWQYVTAGGSNFNWGYPFTPAEVNSPDFGIGITVSGVGMCDAYVDSIEVTVSYAYRCDCTYTCKGDSECGSDGCGAFCGPPSTGGGCDAGTCNFGYCHPDVFVDPVSGLMWHNSGFDVLNCSALTFGGYSDWRIPTIDELRTRVVGCPATATGGQCPATNACLDAGCLDAGCEGCAYRQGPDPRRCYLDNHIEWPSCAGAGPFYSSTLVGGVPYTLDFASAQIAIGGPAPRHRCVRP